MTAITFPTDIVTSSARVQRALSALVSLSGHKMDLEAYFTEAARHLCDLYSASFALIAVKPEGSEDDALDVILVRDGAVERIAHCASSGPNCACNVVLHEGQRYIESGFNLATPLCPARLGAPAKSYFGHAITDAFGTVIGVVAAYSHANLDIDTWTEPVLALYANRVGIEIATKREAEARARLLAEQQALSARLAEEAAARATAEETLREAIRTIPDALVIYDAEDRLLICNEAYRRIYHASAPAIVEGATFRSIIEYGLERGQYPQAGSSDAERHVWLEDRLAQHHLPMSQLEQQTNDGRWLSIHERRSQSGFTVGVRYDITTLKLQNEALEGQAEELKRYASVASHDLQEPLRKIELFADILKEAVETGNKADMDRALSVMVKSAKRGRTLVKALLESARMRSREMHREHFRMDEMVKELAAYLMTGDSREVAFSFDMAPLEVRADPALMTQVLQNLFTNAIRYTKPGEAPKVAIALKPDPQHIGSWRLSVRDEGIGFDMTRKADIFAPFKRLVSRSQIEGTGVGLSTVKMIVDKHRWAIDAESAPDAGATFYIVIPGEDAAFADSDGLDHSAGEGISSVA
ncbi:MAG: PAS-domain containing protein [Hyphomicrobiaceae bacterium]|nr:PAS-domain containing protein [Hyphomicrobiaceae bacterium]